MNLSSKIAFKYTFYRKKLNFISIISIVSFIGITIGVAAVIIVMSIFKGFQDLHKTQLVNLDPHIRIQPKTGKWFDENFNSLELVKLLKKENYINEVAINSLSKVVIISKGIIQPAMLNAFQDTNTQLINTLKEKSIVGNISFQSLFTNNKINNKLSFSINHNLSHYNLIPKIFIGGNLAHKLNVKLGDTITIMTSEMIEKAIRYYTNSDGSQAIVTGIYHTNIENYDDMTIVTNDILIRNLFEGNYKVNTLDIRLKNNDMIDDIENYKSKIIKLISANSHKLFIPDGKSYKSDEKIENSSKKLILSDIQTKLNVQSWYDLNEDIFRIMKFERFASFTIISLIILIASFNIFASLGMSVVEKGNDISILKTLGADDKFISNIFKKSGFIIGVTSSLLGSFIGCGFCLLNIKYKILAINNTAYIIDHIPMKLEFIEVFGVIILAIFFSYIATIIPSKRAIETNIISKLKSE
ncbi:MAG: ABC transporter permease [Candidatus Kapaibacteriota bacterium]